MAIKQSNVVLKCDAGKEELSVAHEWDSVVFNLTDANGKNHSVYVSGAEAEQFASCIATSAKVAKENAEV